MQTGSQAKAETDKTRLTYGGAGFFASRTFADHAFPPAHICVIE